MRSAGSFLTQGITATENIMLIPLAIGLAQIVRCGHGVKDELMPAVAGLACLAGLSVASHKEHRLLATPHLFFAPYVGHGLACLRQSLMRRRKRLWIRMSRLTGTLQVCFITYFLLRHQRGKEQIAVDVGRSLKANGSVAFMTPCHSTPAAIVLHPNVSFDTLDCSPQEGETESEEFVREPVHVANRKFGKVGRIPDAMVLMAPEERELERERWLERNHYMRVQRRFNADFAVDRMDSHVSLYWKHH